MENNLSVRTKTGPPVNSCPTGAPGSSGGVFSTALAGGFRTHPFKDQLGEFSRDVFENLASRFGDELQDAKLSGGSGPPGNNHGSSAPTGHGKPISTMALNPIMYKIPAGEGGALAGNSFGQLGQFRKDVKAKASQILERNKALIDDIYNKYKDSDSPAWNSLKKAMAKDQQLSRAEYEAREEICVQEQYYNLAHYGPYDATDNGANYINNINQTKTELDAAKQKYENIKSARELLRTGYPEIVAVDVYNQDVKGLFSKRIERNASNEEIGHAMADGFERIKDDVDESIDKINNDDVPLETLSYVLDEVRKDPRYSELQDEINGWIEGEQSKDKWIKIGTTGLSTAAGLASLAFGGWPSIVLAGIGVGTGAGGAIYNLERSVDLFDVTQSQRVGHQLSETSYENAKSDLIMSGVDLALSGLDAAAVVKSWKGLSNIAETSAFKKGEEAAHLARAENPTAKAAKEAETLEKSAQKEYGAVKDVDGPKTTSEPEKVPKKKPTRDLKKEYTEIMDADDAPSIKKHLSKKGAKFRKKEKESIKEIFDLDETKEMFPDADFKKAKQRIDSMSDDFSSEEIQEVKKYLFDNNEWSDYDPNNATAWKNLQNGNITEVEETLLKHERVEITLKKKLKDCGIEFNHDDAHFEANEIFDFAMKAQKNPDFQFITP